MFVIFGGPTISKFIPICHNIVFSSSGLLQHHSISGIEFFAEIEEEAWYKIIEEKKGEPGYWKCQ